MLTLRSLGPLAHCLRLLGRESFGSLAVGPMYRDGSFIYCSLQFLLAKISASDLNSALSGER
jgi:hypothetical protein